MIYEADKKKKSSLQQVVEEMGRLLTPINIISIKIKMDPVI